jgi:exosortase/archaeosortase family protein
MDHVVSFLQHASTETTSMLFRLAGTPFTRDGFVFSFHDVDVEVAEQCSGIRSAILTTLGSILAGQLLLHRGWTRAGFVLLSLPVVIFKNAARIAGITWLGLYVDPGFFTTPPRSESVELRLSIRVDENSVPLYHFNAIVAAAN